MEQTVIDLCALCPLHVQSWNNIYTVQINDYVIYNTKIHHRGNWNSLGMGVS